MITRSKARKRALSGDPERSARLRTLASPAAETLRAGGTPVRGPVDLQEGAASSRPAAAAAAATFRAAQGSSAAHASGQPPCNTPAARQLACLGGQCKRGSSGTGETSAAATVPRSLPAAAVLPAGRDRPSRNDKDAAEALIMFASREGKRFVSSGKGGGWFWDGAKFRDNTDGTFTCELGTKHAAEIAADFRVCLDMYTSVGKLSAVSKMVNILTCDREAHLRMDANTKIMAFANGVLELESRVLRPAQFEDYVTMSTGYDFLASRDPDAEQEVMRFLRQVFPCPDMLQFALGRLASCLEGGNLNETAPFWTGASGSNGKSKLAQLVSAALGDYAGTLEGAQFTTNRKAGAANSQLAAVLKCRFVVVEEPDAGRGAQLNWAAVKEVTGRARVQVRDMHSKASARGEQPHFTPFFLFNSLPQDSVSAGGAERRRIETVPFCSEFVDEPSQPHQLPIDVALPDKFPAWRQHLFNILLYDHYVPYVDRGRKLQVCACTKTNAMQACVCQMFAASMWGPIPPWGYRAGAVSQCGGHRCPAERSGPGAAVVQLLCGAQGGRLADAGGGLAGLLLLGPTIAAPGGQARCGIGRQAGVQDQTLGPRWKDACGTDEQPPHRQPQDDQRLEQCGAEGKPGRRCSSAVVSAPQFCSCSRKQCLAAGRPTLSMYITASCR